MLLLGLLSDNSPVIYLELNMYFVVQGNKSARIKSFFNVSEISLSIGSKF